MILTMILQRDQKLEGKSSTRAKERDLKAKTIKTQSVKRKKIFIKLRIKYTDGVLIKKKKLNYLNNDN